MRIALLLLLLSVSTAALGEDPSLSDTMRFIQDKLNAEGPVETLLHIHEGTSGNDQVRSSSVSVSNVTGDVQKCVLWFHWHAQTEGSPPIDQDAGIKLGAVTDVVLNSADSEQERYYASAGRDQLKVEHNPGFFYVVVEGSVERRIPLHTEEMATRIAKAMAHAAELCGAFKKEPF